LLPRPQPHGADLLPGTDHVPFLDEDFLVIAVGRQIAGVVLDDDQVAVSAQAAAGVDHPSRAGGVDRLSQRPSQPDTLLALTCGGEALDQLAIGGPTPGNGAGVRRAGRWSRRSPGRRLLWPRLRCRRARGHRCGAGRQPQPLPRADGVRRIDTVPAGNGTEVEAVAPGDRVEGIAGADYIIAAAADSGRSPSGIGFPSG